MSHEPDETVLVPLDELEREALAANPDVEVPADAVPLDDGRADRIALLPSWYMPVALSAKPTLRHRVTAAIFVGALLVVNGAGFCVTYGVPELPLW